ncbi:hypothetical protein ACFX2J_013609 [Malus domestica]
MWSLRNKIRFEGAKLCMAHAKARILTCSKESVSLVFSSVPFASSAPIFQTLGVSPLLSTAMHFIPVVWKPPMVGWIKVNVDGSFKFTGRTGYGGVFLDSHGIALGAFALSTNFCSSIAAEVLAVITAIRVAYVREWHHIWLETDSTMVIHYLNSPSYIVQWYLCVDWSNCLW